MQNSSLPPNQITVVNGFQHLVQTELLGEMNAICWKRELLGDFEEIVSKIVLEENVTLIEEEQLLALQLSEEGNCAREIILSDMRLLEAHGADPNLNLIKSYDRDAQFPFFPTDVYSFHVDRSPIPLATFLCTYYGASSELIANTDAQQKILIPEIRQELRKIYDGEDQGFETFLSEHFFDLHFEPKPNAAIHSFGLGNMWRLATDYPDSQVLPCIHRAPLEKPGEYRLLLIC
ncbi:MAG: hypothetical protein CFE21_03490 [Bacteroidetes bacterium B1(2017)]|nr:MAG: hypothetical protein CFE21_03490 [Bacteroidetes bacterium B1(2017)]